MAYAPISYTLPQYEDYPNWWLKGYEQGTVTPLSMATDVTGGTTLAKAELDSTGFPITTGPARFTPWFDEAYDLWLFPTEAEADANDTNNAIQLSDNIDPAGTGGVNVKVSSNDTTSGFLNGKLTAGTNITLTENNDGGNETLAVAVANSPTFSGNVKFSKGADVASATALSLGTDGNYFDITGTTSITSIDTVAVGTVIKLHFDAIVTLTHHATDLILPGAKDILTNAGDEAEFIEYAAGDWRCTNYSDSTTPAQEDLTIKPSDQSITNDDVYNNDDDLTVSLAANGVYDFESLLHASSASATPGIDMQWLVSGASYDGYVITAPNTGAAGAIAQMDNASNNVQMALAANGGTQGTAYFKFTLTDGGAGGSLSLRWAQDVSNGTATILRAGSWCRVKRVG